MGNFSYELKELKGAIIRPIIVFMAVAVALFVFGSPTFATQIFLSAKAFLIPKGVSLVVLGPVSAFIAPLLMVFLIAFLATFPYMLYSFMRFLMPALLERERRTLYLLLIPSLILFYLGCALAYFVIIPETFSILYSFAAPLGVTTFFSLDTFISSVFLVTISVGVLFLLPVVMVMLTRVGILSQQFWFIHWREAILSTVIFSAVITPDGTGVTMVFLSIPLLVLYGIGALVSRESSSV